MWALDAEDWVGMIPQPELRKMGYVTQHISGSIHRRHTNIRSDRTAFYLSQKLLLRERRQLIF